MIELLKQLEDCIVQKYQDQLDFYNEKLKEYTSMPKGNYERKLLISGLVYRHDKLVKKMADLRTAKIELEKCFEPEIDED